MRAYLLYEFTVGAKAADKIRTSFAEDKVSECTVLGTTQLRTMMQTDISNLPTGDVFQLIHSGSIQNFNHCRKWFLLVHSTRYPEETGSVLHIV